MLKLLLATIRDVVSSLLFEMVKTMILCLESALSSNCDYLQTIDRETESAVQFLTNTVVTFQDARRSTQQPVNSSCFTLAEEEKRQHSAVFTDGEGPCDLPQQRQ
ncbi:hypothetical protein Tcan_04436 [Toxocara canis]|uniref:Uncharacterized protein n=1 Tax=Toxocara canis TaxID=6265 RepID=A0A0B2VD17_TOXCA|nr:hypothetical protein Tcan_04436 [Toxocara canis]